MIINVITHTRLPLLLLAASLLLSAATARAATAPEAPIPHGTVTLLAEKPILDPHAETSLALHFVLEPGWHTYWSNPGDSGEAPRLVWHLPAGLAAGAISWPAPKRLAPAPNVMDFGYSDDAVLLVPVRSSGGLVNGTTANLGVEIKLVVCREVCIPGKATVSLSLPIGAGLAGATAHASPQTAKVFSEARSHLPKPAPPAWKLRAQDTRTDFVLDLDAGHAISRATFFPIDEDEIANAAPQPVDATPKGLRIHLRKSSDLKAPIKRLRGLLVLGDAAYAVDAPVS
jgi:DsbC/DsbD-like thiol-disulfide interchange protein